MKCDANGFMTCGFTRMPWTYGLLVYAMAFEYAEIRRTKLMNDKGLKLRGKQRTKQVWIQDENGDPKQIRLSYLTAKYTARDAKRAYVADLAKINAGKFVASKPMTVRQYVTSWLTENRHDCRKDLGTLRVDRPYSPDP